VFAYKTRFFLSLQKPASNDRMSNRNVNHFHRMLNPTGYIPVGLTQNLKFLHVFLVQVLGNYQESFKGRPLVRNRLKLQSTSTNLSMACIWGDRKL